MTQITFNCKICVQYCIYVIYAVLLDSILMTEPQNKPEITLTAHHNNREL